MGEEVLERKLKAYLQKKQDAKMREIVAKRKPRKLERTFIIDNEIKSFMDWCRKYEISPQAVTYRMSCGWGFEKALKTPVKKRVFKTPEERSPSIEALKKPFIFIDYSGETAKERLALNMGPVNDFLCPEVGEGEDMDYNDTDKRINALKRSFNALYGRNQKREKL